MNRRGGAGSQWARTLGSGWRALCPSWRDSNCPGPDTMPEAWAPSSLSIQLATRPPTGREAGLARALALKNRNNCLVPGIAHNCPGLAAPFLSQAPVVPQSWRWGWGGGSAGVRCTVSTQRGAAACLGRDSQYMRSDASRH